MADRSTKVQPEGIELTKDDTMQGLKVKIEEQPIAKPEVKPADSHDDLVKMPPSGMEQIFPRKDNYFMTK